MTAFRYQAVEGDGAPIKGTIEASDRKAALDLLSQRGLFPSELQVCPAGGNGTGVAVTPAISERGARRLERPIARRASAREERSRRTRG